MKPTTIAAIITTLCAAAATAASNATLECISRIETNAAMQHALQDANMTASAICAGAPDTDTDTDTDTVTVTGADAVNVNVNGNVVKADVPHNPPTLDEMLRWISCEGCREKYNKCMNVSTLFPGCRMLLFLFFLSTPLPHPALL